MPTITTHKTPSWFKKTSLAHSFYFDCPDTFTMPDNHFCAVLGARDEARVTPQMAFDKGVNFVEFGAFASEPWFNSMDPRMAKISAFANDVWTRVAPGPKNWPGGVSDWINTHSYEEVRIAYTYGAAPNNLGFSLDDLEAFPFLDIRGARNLYQVWKKAMDERTVNCKWFGGWNTHYWGGGGDVSNAEKKAEIYTKTQAQLYQKPSDYGFSALWADPLYPETPTDKRRLIYGYNYAVIGPYLTGIFDDLTTLVIEGCEASLKVFPDIMPVVMQWELEQVSGTGATYFPAGPLGYYQGHYHKYFPENDTIRDQGFGTWTQRPDGIPYPPDAMWNLHIWGYLYGSAYHWFMGGSSNDQTKQSYHKNMYGPTDFADLARWTWGAVPRFREILESTQPVELCEYSMDNGNTWKTGNLLAPAMARKNQLPIVRLKRSMDGSKCVIIAYHEFARNGTSTNIRVRVNGSTTVDVVAKQYTQLHHVVI